MKKTRCLYIIIATLLFLPSHSHAASGQTKKNSVTPLHLTQKSQVKNDVQKGFIIEILASSMFHDRFKYYAQHYRSRELSCSFSVENAKVWLVPSYKGEYTHIVKIQLYDVQVKLKEGKKISTTETFTYRIKAGHLANYLNKKEITSSVKLISFYHKVK